MKPDLVWRALLAAGAAGILYGGPRHPDGTLLEMLQDPEWVPAHAWVTAGFFLFTMGFYVWGQRRGLSGGLQRSWRWALVGLAVQDFEWVIHTLASVDADRLAAGELTPVLSTHLGLVLVAYPLFAATSGLFLVAAARERALGSWWILPLGLFALVAHGIAPWLVLVFGIEEARVLFPMVVFFALWLIGAAFWPVRSPATRSRPAAAG